MNRKILLFFLCFMLSVSAVFADDELSDDSESVPVDVDTPATVVVDITQLLNQQKDDSSDQKETDPQEVYTIEPELIGVTMETQRISPSDTSGFKAVLLTLLGDYETTITDYEYRTGTSQYTSHSINIERDWTWICSCCIFGLLIWCTFRSIGGICARW